MYGIVDKCVSSCKCICYVRCACTRAYACVCVCLHKLCLSSSRLFTEPFFMRLPRTQFLSAIIKCDLFKCVWVPHAVWFNGNLRVGKTGPRINVYKIKCRRKTLKNEHRAGIYFACIDGILDCCCCCCCVDDSIQDKRLTWRILRMWCDFRWPFRLPSSCTLSPKYCEYTCTLNCLSLQCGWKFHVAYKILLRLKNSVNMFISIKSFLTLFKWIDFF